MGAAALVSPEDDMQRVVDLVGLDADHRRFPKDVEGAVELLGVGSGKTGEEGGRLGAEVPARVVRVP